MVRFGERNSRLKDFYDLYVLAHEFPFAGEQLTAAIAATFKRRNTPIDLTQPVALAPRFYADTARATQWRTYLERNRLPGAPHDFDAAGELIRQFLGPLWSVLAENMAFSSRWRPGGPWNSEAIENEIHAASSSTASTTSHGQGHSDNADTVSVEDIEAPIAVPLRRFKSYPAYKDSGVEWLGNLPTDWDVKRLKFVLEAPLKYGANEAAELDDPDLPRYVRITDIDESDGLRDDTFKSLPAEIAKEYLLCEGDLLLARSGATAGKTFLYKRSWGACAYAGYLIRARLDIKKVRPEFVRYFTASRNYWRWLASAFIQATIQNVSAERYASLRLPLPRLIEQRVIIAFLDRETAKIDTLVAKKERLIQLLQEKRAALITRAVTKGLDPNAPMKDSGVEWVGQIPEHWERKPAKAVCQRIIDCKNRTPEYDEDGDFPVVRTTDVKDGNLSFTQCLRTDEKNFRAWTLRGAPERDDILFTREAPAGEAALYDGTQPICLGQRMMYFRVNPEILVSRFLLYSIYGALVKGYILTESGGSTVSHRRLAQVYNLPLLIPPVTEQNAIVGYLDGHTTVIDRMVRKVREGIEYMKEFRTALISAAVTGKIDVRGEAV
jgi:type I restriction enzyme S subunit